MSNERKMTKQGKGVKKDAEVYQYHYNYSVTGSYSGSDKSR
jgi:hypothetical protein